MAGVGEVRQINPETGKPYQRKSSMKWAEAFRIVRHRKAHEKIIASGFVECRSWAKLPFEYGTHKIVGTTIHPDGTRLYVKMEDGWKPETFSKPPPQEWFEQNYGPLGKR